MHDFNRFVYLSLQKTGSTYISHFLRHSSKLKLVKKKRHMFLTDDYDPSKFYFISIRDPLKIYSSLYRFGLQRKGGLYDNLFKAQLSHIYGKNNNEDFNQFLSFILDDKNKIYLREDFSQIPNSFNLGFVSFRFLKLIFPYPIRTLLAQEYLLNSKTNFNIKLLLNLSIVNSIIKIENVKSDLIRITNKFLPQYFDKKKVDSFLNESKPLNTSTKEAETFSLNESNREKFLSKERFLLSFYE